MSARQQPKTDGLGRPNLRRTTIEIDENLLERARQALGTNTPRGTVEDALRRAAIAAEVKHAARVERQRRYLKGLRARIHVTALRSWEVWG